MKDQNYKQKTGAYCKTLVFSKSLIVFIIVLYVSDGVLYGYPQMNITSSSNGSRYKITFYLFLKIRLYVEVNGFSFFMGVNESYEMEIISWLL